MGDRWNRPLRVIPVLCAIFLASSGRLILAEDAPGASPPGLVEHVQVITTRVPEKTETTPASVTVLTRDELIRRGAYDLRSALLVLAGIDISPGGDGGPASAVPEIWGLREFDAFLLTVDGIPWGGAFNPSLETLDLTNVDRIEVLRGAAPVTYGATSFVGVINVVHTAPGEGGPSLRASGGSYDSGSVAYSTPIPQWGGVSSSLSVDGGHQGFRDDRMDFARAHLRWQNSLHAGPGVLRFNVDGFSQKQDPGSPIPRVGDELTPLVPFDSNQNPIGSYLDQEKYTMDGTYERPAGSATWSNTVSFSHSRQSIFRGFLVDAVPPPDNAHGFRQAIPVLDAYLDSHFVLHPAGKVEVIAGFDHLHGQGHARGGDFDYSVNLDGSSPPSGSDLPNQALVKIRDRRDFSGLYSQVIWRPVDRINIEAGGRINRAAESRNTDSLEFGSTEVVSEDRRDIIRGSGFVGLTWTTWKSGSNDLNLFANYRNTFKPAAIDFGLDADPEILAPETAETFEGGVKSGLLGGRLALELSAFQMDFTNLVLSQVVGGVPALVNGGSQRFRGIELMTAMKPKPMLEWRVVYSLHDARFRDFVTEFGGVPTQLRGKRLEMSARNMAATEFIVGKSTGWRGSARANWVGSRFLNKRNTAVAPDYITWSAGIGYALQNVEIRLDGVNINNQRPPVSESELGDAQYYLLPARSIFASMRWTPGGETH
jgi:iron complex outermembrane receptor protein